LRMLEAGLGTKEIAGRSGRSVYTVRAHVANAIAKLGCNGRAAAIATARRLGVMD
jgi:DNA-binding CsgD family transcriptional regulator